MQPLFAYNASLWKNTITILTLILFVVFLVCGLYLLAVLGKHLLTSNQGFQYQQQARDIRNSFSCSSLCPPWSGAHTGQQTLWLSGSLLALWMAVGRAPAPCVVRFMYMQGLAARSVVLGSGSSGWAVAPAGFVGSCIREVGLPSIPPPLRCRFGGGGFNFPVAVCAGGPPLAGGRGLRPVVPASPFWGGGVVP